MTTGLEGFQFLPGEFVWSETRSHVMPDQFVSLGLAVIGPVGTGEIRGLPTVTVTHSGSCFPTQTATSIPPAIIGVVMAPTCKIHHRVTPVSLKPVAPKDLLPVGKAAGRTDFNVPLSCSGSSEVYVTMSDANDSNNRGSLLTPDSDSSAHGVRVRMLRNGTAIEMGPDSPVAGTPNQWRVGPAENVQALPLSPEYVSVGPVRAGTVNAKATFTLSYQ